MSDDGVCTCGKRVGFMRDEDSIDELWVCVNCGWPARLYLERACERMSE